jgi:hypothetical protein
VPLTEEEKKEVGILDGIVEGAGAMTQGFLRFTLIWHTLDDLDLHVTNPKGEDINWYTTEDSYGGMIDVDMNQRDDVYYYYYSNYYYYQTDPTTGEKVSYGNGGKYPKGAVGGTGRRLAEVSEKDANAIGKYEEALAAHRKQHRGAIREKFEEHRNLIDRTFMKKHGGELQEGADDDGLVQTKKYWKKNTGSVENIRWSEKPDPIDLLDGVFKVKIDDYRSKGSWMSGNDSRENKNTSPLIQAVNNEDKETYGDVTTGIPFTVYVFHDDRVVKRWTGEVVGECLNVYYDASSYTNPECEKQLEYHFVAQNVIANDAPEVSSESKPECRNTPPLWADKDGADCKTYENSNYCKPDGSPGDGFEASWGIIADMAAVGEVDASVACCFCGGGEVLDPSTFTNSTGSDAGSDSGSDAADEVNHIDVACQQVVLGWTDTGGDNCAKYFEESLCTTDGQPGAGWQESWGPLSDYANSQGIDATQACCECGGGVAVKRASLETTGVYTFDHSNYDLQVDHYDTDWTVTEGNVSGLHFNVRTFTIPSESTVTVRAYDGAVPGSGQFEVYAKNIVVNGKLNGNGAGFKGGVKTHKAGANGANGNGPSPGFGGCGNCHISKSKSGHGEAYGQPGGGGGHMTAGELGGEKGGPGGAEHFKSFIIFKGSGGGAGGSSIDMDQNPPGGYGGGGGAAILMYATEMLSLGDDSLVSADGGNGQGYKNEQTGEKCESKKSQCCCFDLAGPGGGGSGGTVILQSKAYAMSDEKMLQHISANGGMGGDGRGKTQQGGDGGNGQAIIGELPDLPDPFSCMCKEGFDIDPTSSTQCLGTPMPTPGATSAPTPEQTFAPTASPDRQCMDGSHGCDTFTTTCMEYPFTGQCNCADDAPCLVQSADASVEQCLPKRIMDGVGAFNPDIYKNPLLAMSCPAGTTECAAGLPRNCRDVGSKIDGVYTVLLNDGQRHQVYCDQTTDGGGWMLMLTQADPASQYDGSVNPLTAKLNTDYPSPSTVYSLNWENLLEDPQPGDEFLLKRGASSQWVRFRQEGKWCGWRNTRNCNNPNPTRASKDLGSIFFTTGKLFDETGYEIPPALNSLGENAPFHYFNGCALGGDCAIRGIDGIGFGNYEAELRGNSGSKAYGGSGWPSGMRWATEEPDKAGKGILPYTYWYRPPTTDGVTYRCECIPGFHEDPSSGYKSCITTSLPTRTPSARPSTVGQYPHTVAPSASPTFQPTHLPTLMMCGPSDDHGCDPESTICVTGLAGAITGAAASLSVPLITDDWSTSGLGTVLDATFAGTTVGGDGYIESDITLTAPVTVQAQLKMGDAGSAGSSCMTMSLFNAGHGKNEGLAMEVLGNGQLLISPGNFADDLGVASTNNEGFRELKISVDADGAAKFYVDGSFVYGTTTSLASGKIVFVSGCGDTTVRSVMMAANAEHDFTDQGSKCVSSPSKWTDKLGYPCATYATQNWCTPGGGTGSAWDASWGDLSSMAGPDGVDASQACCECGGGVLGGADSLAKDQFRCACLEGFVTNPQSNTTCVATISPTPIPSTAPSQAVPTSAPITPTEAPTVATRAPSTRPTMEPTHDPTPRGCSDSHECDSLSTICIPNGAIKMGCTSTAGAGYDTASNYAADDDPFDIGHYNLRTMREGESAIVSCPTNCDTGYVWGSGVYADDSRVCLAGLHRTGQDGGFFGVTLGGSEAALTATVSNGVSSRPFGFWHRTFKLSAASGYEDQLSGNTCMCKEGFMKSPTSNTSCILTPAPTLQPTHIPTITPTNSPTKDPTKSSPPSLAPTLEPTLRPTADPTLMPSHAPTFQECDDGAHGCDEQTTLCIPLGDGGYVCTCREGYIADFSSTTMCFATPAPTPEPSMLPTLQPSGVPTEAPTVPPTRNPTLAPTHLPTAVHCAGTGAPFGCDTATTICVTEPPGSLRDRSNPVDPNAPRAGEGRGDPNTVEPMSDVPLDPNVPVLDDDVAPSAGGDGEDTTHYCVCLEGYVTNPDDPFSCLSTIAPTFVPTFLPTNEPTGFPTEDAEVVPSFAPTHRPTRLTCADGQHGCDEITTLCLQTLSSDGGASYACVCKEGFIPNPDSDTSCMATASPTAAPTPKPCDMDICDTTSTRCVDLTASEDDAGDGGSYAAVDDADAAAGADAADAAVADASLRRLLLSDAKRHYSSRQLEDAEFDDVMAVLNAGNDAAMAEIAKLPWPYNSVVCECLEGFVAMDDTKTMCASTIAPTYVPTTAPSIHPTQIPTPIPSVKPTHMPTYVECDGPHSCDEQSTYCVADHNLPAEVTGGVGDYAMTGPTPVGIFGVDANEAAKTFAFRCMCKEGFTANPKDENSCLSTAAPTPIPTQIPSTSPSGRPSVEPTAAPTGCFACQLSINGECVGPPIDRVPVDRVGIGSDEFSAIQDLQASLSDELQPMMHTASYIHDCLAGVPVKHIGDALASDKEQAADKIVGEMKSLYREDEKQMTQISEDLAAADQKGQSNVQLVEALEAHDEGLAGAIDEHTDTTAILTGDMDAALQLQAVSEGHAPASAPMSSVRGKSGAESALRSRSSKSSDSASKLEQNTVAMVAAVMGLIALVGTVVIKMRRTAAASATIAGGGVAGAATVGGVSRFSDAFSFSGARPSESDTSDMLANPEGQVCIPDVSMQQL